MSLGVIEESSSSSSVTVHLRRPPSWGGGQCSCPSRASIGGLSESLARSIWTWLRLSFTWDLFPDDKKVEIKEQNRHARCGCGFAAYLHRPGSCTAAPPATPAHHVQDGLLPLKQTVRHLLEPRKRFLDRRP
jgi:hypothetical protein